MNFASIAYVHGPDSGAISSNMVAAAAERMFNVLDNAVNYFARPAAGIDCRAVTRLHHCAVRASAVTGRTP
jgi:hypothetical protein